MRNRAVLISGIGIAGPTLVYWLACYGFEATLIELWFWRGDPHEFALWVALPRANYRPGFDSPVAVIALPDSADGLIRSLISNLCGLAQSPPALNRVGSPISGRVKTL
jgi:hypothetical protein